MADNWDELTDREILEAALKKTGLSISAFAEYHMVRDARQVSRWLSGEQDIPPVAIRRMKQIIRG
jgi:hypothetical protein